ncbi:uncharacterized protein [Chironomus tepperi]|uniref:uncharacterized protein n=1 Tax=Chironomus tepperi TaxID=113505 RepID=UPI00391F7F18
MQEPMCNGCCCFSLRTGGLIIGWFNSLVGFFGMVIILSIMGYMLQQSSDTPYVDMDYYYGLKYVDKFVFTGILLFIAFLFLLELISGGLLIIGIIEGRHKHMIMYMILSFIGILLEFLGLFSSANSTREVIKELIGISFQIYYLCVVYSLYVVIKNRNLQQRASHIQEYV